MTDWKRLLEAVRADCLVGLWSKGAALARDGAVAGVEHEAGAWSFRVRTAGRAVAPTVALYPQDAEWDCDCEGNFDPCEHVAACAIVMAQSADAANVLFSEASRAGRIRYDLHAGDAGLTVDRVLVGSEGEGSEKGLAEPLVDLLARAGSKLALTPTAADLTIDRLLGGALSSPLPFEKAVTLLKHLVAANDVTLDGRPVRASGEPIHPHARVVDAAGDGVEVIVEPDPDVTRVVAPGVLLRGDTLHPFAARNRFGERWEKLPLRRVFQKREIAELVSRVLPELERDVAVDVRTERLPKREGKVAPWIRFEIDFVDQGVDVLPLLVYGDPPLARIDGERLVHLRGAVPERTPRLEKELVLRLRDRLNLVPGRRSHFSSADAAKFLATLEAFDDGRPGKAKARSAAMRRVALTPRLVGEGDAIELVFEGSEKAQEAGGARAAAGAVVAAWRDGIGLVPLDDGRFGAVPAGWLASHGELVADLLAAREQNAGRTPAAAMPLLGELCEALDTPPPLAVARVRTLLDELVSLQAGATGGAQAAGGPGAAPVAGAEPGFRGQLRHYQAEGAAWLARLRDAGLGAVLADDMGLGKTVQALAVLRGRTLIVCPRSVIFNWINEIERFRPDVGVLLYHGPSRALTPAAITLTTYATLRLDAGALAEVEWDAVVLDEAQAIKNPDSQAARAAYGLEAGFRLSLSGTPIENRLDELWSQMHFANRGLLGGRRDFAERYERPILLGDAEAAARLRRRIRPFVLRRLKKEVATELPPRTDSVLRCELDSEERALYDAIRLAARTDVVRRLEGGGGVMAAFEALLRLRQACCHAALLPGRGETSSSKLEALMDALDDAVADGHKALVFSQWTSFLDLIEPHLEAHEIPFVRLDGTTRDRGAVVDAFQSEDGPPVLLISLKAGGTGLNLTAADHVFLLDPWWNPAVEEQAADRAHRIGQDRPVMVYRLVAKDTVEERVLDLQKRKRAIAETALAAGAEALDAAITREDILALLD